MRDRISGHPVRFVVTGLYRPRQVSEPYWGLNDVALSGSSTLSGFTTYGPDQEEENVTIAAIINELRARGWAMTRRRAGDSDGPAGSEG